MSDTRTPDEIERDLERHRSDLETSLGALQQTFTPEAIFRSVSDGISRNGGDFGKSVGDAAKANPLALAVTGIGLGWLIFGQGPSASRIADDARGPSDGTSWFGGGRKTAYGEDADAHIQPSGPVPAGAGPNWFEGTSGPSTGQRARAGWHNAQRSASDRAGRVRDRSSEMAHRLSEGTESMTAEARERIVAAREQAVLASENAGRGLRRGADQASDFFEEHPIVVGALAFAVGAAIAGSLPRSRYEDEHFGAESDNLYHEAERVFAEERAKVERVAGAALDEARNVGEEVRADADHASRELKDRADRDTRGDGTAADAAVDRTEDAARRVAHAAEQQAKTEDFSPSRS